MAGLSQVSLREMTSYLNLSSSDDSSRSFGLRLWMFRWPMRSPFGWLPPQRCPLLPRRRALGARLPRRVRLGGAAAEVSGRPNRSRAAVGVRQRPRLGTARGDLTRAAVAATATSITVERWSLAGRDDSHQVLHYHQCHEKPEQVTVSRWSKESHNQVSRSRKP